MWRYTIPLFSLALAGCFDPGGTIFDDMFHPQGTCAIEAKVLNQSSQPIAISASLYDSGPAYCKDKSDIKVEKTVAPGEFGSARAELVCNRCWELRKSASVNGLDADGTNVVTCTDAGCQTN